MRAIGKAHIACYFNKRHVVAQLATIQGNWMLTGAEKADRLERFSKVASVVAFAIFNIAYWAYYLGQ